MTVANLYNVFTEATGKDQFSFSNASLHALQNQAIFVGTGRELSSYVLDPIPTGENLVNWLEAHQDIHNQVNAILGIAGNDLTDVDFNNQEQVAAWVWLHAEEHRQAVQKLGIQA